MAERGADQVRIERADQPAVGGDEDHCCALDVAAREQRVRLRVGVWTEVVEDRTQALFVGSRGEHGLPCPFRALRKIDEPLGPEAVFVRSGGLLEARFVDQPVPRETVAAVRGVPGQPVLLALRLAERAGFRLVAQPLAADPKHNDAV